MSRSRLKGSNQNGFTLLELMIVVIVIAVLVALAYPSYTQYVRKAKRADAQQLLMNWSVNQEIYRANHTTYSDGTEADGIPAPTMDNYVFQPSNVTASTFTLTATAANDQANDKEDGVSCGVMTIDQNGQKQPIECWGGSS